MLLADHIMHRFPAAEILALAQLFPLHARRAVGLITQDRPVPVQQMPAIGIGNGLAGSRSCTGPRRCQVSQNQGTNQKGQQGGVPG
ncbi:hypothetical protein CSB20_07165 [bacterium DOLZORAL124_64_63]|nr:MAG: hypothetical protein CSB20_07165 [bacterium DOLZORAL124_64_63]